MRNKKHLRANLINGLIAGLMLFNCTCTLCNKRYNMGFFAPKIGVAQQIVERGTQKFSAIKTHASAWLF